MDSGRFLGSHLATALNNGTLQQEGEAKKNKTNLLFLNLFILTAQKDLSSCRAAISVGALSNSVGYMKRRSVQKPTWGIGKGSHKQLHSTMKARQTVGHPSPALCEPQFPSLQSGTTHSSPKDWCEADAGQDALRARYTPGLEEHRHSSRLAAVLVKRSLSSLGKQRWKPHHFSVFPERDQIKNQG